MAMLIEDCPRCGERKMTLDVLGEINAVRDGVIKSDWFELFCKCRHCNAASMFLAYNKENTQPPSAFAGTINRLFSLHGVIRPRGTAISCPEYVEAEIKTIFDEGAECLSFGCWNAAAAMFRKVVDVISKSKLPPETDPTSPDKYTRRTLKPRLTWLFANSRLPTEIANLAECIREDGNDAVHDHPLKQADAEDLLDFTVQLLERVYTNPGRLQAAADRRNARRESTPKP